MYKSFLIIFFLIISISLPCFAGMSSTTYSISNDIFCAGASVGLSSTNYSVNDVLGNGSGVTSGDISSTDYDIEGGSHSFTENVIWYLAEGTTRSPYQEWVTIMNPNSNSATIRATYMMSTASTTTSDYAIPPNRRYTIDVNNTLTGLGFTNADVSTKIESITGSPIFVERPMYFSGGSIDPIGGHDCAGVTQTSTTWYLAEGTTRSPYQEWITIQNPNATDALVTVTYMTSTTSTATAGITVSANRRHTIDVNSTLTGLGITDADVSAKIESTNGVGIIVERPMYWTGGGYDPVGGHDSTASR